MDLSQDPAPAPATLTAAPSLHSALASLQAASCLVDLQLVAATGEAVKCHKIVLAAASGLLRRLFEENDEKVSFPHLTNSPPALIIADLPVICSGLVSSFQYLYGDIDSDKLYLLRDQTHQGPLCSDHWSSLNPTTWPCHLLQKLGKPGHNPQSYCFIS